MNRYAAYSVMVLACLVGGISLLGFGAFLVAGPFTLIRFDIPEAQGLLWNAFLSLLFFLQHSGMVRPWFRARISFVPPHYQPATYAIASGTVLLAVVTLWQTSQEVLFETSGPLSWLLRAISVFAVAGLAWGVLVLKSFDPFGQAPVRSMLRARPERPPQFVIQGPYFWVRHPLYFCVLALIWSNAKVTLDGLLFSVLWTSWIVMGAYLEEKDLVALFGERYRRYQAQVPMLLPWRGPVGRGM